MVCSGHRSPCIHAKWEVSGILRRALLHDICLESTLKQHNRKEQREAIMHTFLQVCNCVWGFAQNMAKGIDTGAGTSWSTLPLCRDPDANDDFDSMTTQRATATPSTGSRSWRSGKRIKSTRARIPADILPRYELGPAKTYKIGLS